jgi:hypothetical protein
MNVSSTPIFHSNHIHIFHVISSIALLTYVSLNKTMCTPLSIVLATPIGSPYRAYPQAYATQLPRLPHSLICLVQVS